MKLTAFFTSHLMYQHTCAQRHSGWKTRAGWRFVPAIILGCTWHDSFTFTLPDVTFPLILLDLSNLFSWAQEECLEQGGLLSCQTQARNYFQFKRTNEMFHCLGILMCHKSSGADWRVNPESDGEQGVQQSRRRAECRSEKSRGGGPVAIVRVCEKPIGTPVSHSCFSSRSAVYITWLHLLTWTVQSSPESLDFTLLSTNKSVCVAGCLRPRRPATVPPGPFNHRSQTANRWCRGKHGRYFLSAQHSIFHRPNLRPGWHKSVSFYLTRRTRTHKHAASPSKEIRLF